MLEFVWPFMFYLAPLPLLFRWLVPALKGGSREALKVPFFNSWAALQSDDHSVASSSRFNMILIILAWLCLVVAVARPQWVGDAIEIPTSGRDLMLAVDLSGSMERPDFYLGDKQVDRLTAVKVVAGDFIERRMGDRIGLILFGKRAYVQTPLTFDRKTVSTMLDESVIGLAGKETAIGDAIGLAVKRLKERPQQSRVLILLTDGANTAGEVEPMQAASLAADTGLKIYTIGVGADKMEVQTFFGTRTVDPSSELDERTLTGIATTTGGKYFRAKDTEGLEKIYQLLDKLEPARTEKEVFRPTSQLFHWLASIALTCYLILGWRLGLLSGPLLPRKDAGL